MAVVNKYTDADVAAGKKGSALKTGSGTETVTIMGTVSVLAADDDGSVYRVFADVPSSLVPLQIEIHNTAVTGGTDYDVGLYKVKGGAEVDKDILADGISMATARTIATSNNAGMTTIVLGTVADLATLSAQAEPDASYDIALTGNTVGTADGTIRVRGVFAYL
jgi:hypothetical protein